jgi:hypothetical protein
MTSTNLDRSQALQLRRLPRVLNLRLAKLHSPFRQYQAGTDRVTSNLRRANHSQGLRKMYTCSFSN